jgi:hypothetical protein
MDRSDLIEPFKGGGWTGATVTDIDGQPIRGTKLSAALVGALSSFDRLKREFNRGLSLLIMA